MTATAPHFRVVVRFTPRDGARTMFLPFVRANAAASMVPEPDGLRLGLPVSDEDDRILVDELCSDGASLDEYLASPRSHTFDETYAPFLVSESVQQLRAHDHAE